MYTPESTTRRVKNSLLTSLILFPFVLLLCPTLQKCREEREHIQLTDTVQSDRDSLRSLPEQIVPYPNPLP